ncbi:hypothetical protein [Absidia glauca]|uniref:Uncharacterized protein n=1 Tax=Absidia glauca TaxID=4829 RepID=A0A168QDY8_ABSGL|nr:hypothetical protein [Absidia glauca]
MIVSTTTIIVPSPSSTILASPSSYSVGVVPSSTPSITQAPGSYNNGPIIGGLIGGVLLIMSLVSCLLYQRLSKKKRQRIGHQDETKEWSLTKTWSTATGVEAPPPAYYSSSHVTLTPTITKRWTQDSTMSKPASFVKQYSPQLAYSPSDHSMLRDGHGSMSPSHTLVDSNGWLHQKEELNLPTEQQRRSIQPYQAQLNTSTCSFSDALEPPGPYQTGILLHTPPPPPP